MDIGWQTGKQANWSRAGRVRRRPDNRRNIIENHKKLTAQKEVLTHWFIWHATGHSTDEAGDWRPDLLTLPPLCCPRMRINGAARPAVTAVLDGWIHMRMLRGCDRNRNRSGKGGNNIITITMNTLREKQSAKPINQKARGNDLYI